MKLSLEKKHAFVCGSTDGIGKASALQLAKSGCEITLIARDKIKLKNTLLELSINHGQSHSYIIVDFDDTEIYINDNTRFEEFYNHYNLEPDEQPNFVNFKLK
mgnify:CR=1 FL=1